MEVNVEKVGNKYDTEGHRTIEVALTIRTPIKPYSLGRFEWNKPGEGADPGYVSEYNAAKADYDLQVENYKIAYERYLDEWFEINKLHLGNATLKQATEKKVA